MCACAGEAERERKSAFLNSGIKEKEEEEVMAATFSGRNCVFLKNSGAMKTFFLIRVGKIRDSNEIFLLSHRKKQASVGNMKWRGPYSTLFKRWILMGGGENV